MGAVMSRCGAVIAEQTGLREPRARRRPGRRSCVGPAALHRADG